jgi:hypothetical protein
MSTDRQTSYLASLVRQIEQTTSTMSEDERGPIAPAVDNLRSALSLAREGSMSTEDASVVIGQAKALADALVATVPDLTVKWCKLASGKWGVTGSPTILVVGSTITVTRSNGETQDVVVEALDTTTNARPGKVCASVRQPGPVAIPAGIYCVPGKGLYRSEGRHYCDHFVPCHWAYCGTPEGVTLDASTVADARTARAVGWLMGLCMYCGRDLSNAASVVAGYGPTCAKHHDLPHGSTELPPGVDVLAELLWLASLDVGVTEAYARDRAAQFSERLADATT